MDSTNEERHEKRDERARGEEGGCRGEGGRGAPRKSGRKAHAPRAAGAGMGGGA